MYIKNLCFPVFLSGAFATSFCDGWGSSGLWAVALSSLIASKLTIVRLIAFGISGLFIFFPREI